MIAVMLWHLAVGGVNQSLEGNGGPDCVNYLSIWQKIIETLIATPLGVYGIYWSYSRLHIPMTINEQRATKIFEQQQHERVVNEYSNNTNQIVNNNNDDDTTTVLSRCLLIIYFIIFIIELVYKLMSKTAIFLLNPCHLTTIMQLMLLLSMNNDRQTTSTCRLFRFHMYTMPGALLALAFPILNTRELPGEIVIYYAQHLLIVIVPLYLIYRKGAFVPEPIDDISWAIFSLSFLLLYHYIPLQFVANITEVNLNCIMCPAVSDPFKNRFWRIFAVFHQYLFVPTVTKVYYLVAIQTFRCFYGKEYHFDKRTKVE